MSIISRFHENQHRLLVTGSDGDDNITVSRDLFGHLFTNGQAADGANTGNTEVIQVNGGDGNDVITLDDSNGPLPPAHILGGDGNDTLTGSSASDDLNGQDGNDSLFGRGGDDLLSGGAGNDFIAGGAGNDVLDGGAGDDFLDGDQGTDIAFLGAGNDIFRWDQGDGSDTVFGGTGNDELLFNGFAANEQFFLNVQDGHALFTRTQGNIVMDLTEVENVTVNALAGADTVTINNPNGSAVQEIDINLGLNGAGDNALDRLLLNGGTNFNVVNDGHGDLTITGLFDAVVHVTGFEVTDQLVINGDIFPFI